MKMTNSLADENAVILKQPVQDKACLLQVHKEEITFCKHQQSVGVNLPRNNKTATITINQSLTNLFQITLGKDIANVQPARQYVCVFRLICKNWNGFREKFDLKTNIKRACIDMLIFTNPKLIHFKKVCFVTINVVFFMNWRPHG